MLTYPRTDSRFLPEDYLPDGARRRSSVLAGSPPACGQFARQILEKDWVKPNRRIFDNAKISDHFAIIPTLQPPKNLSEAEQKIYDLVVRRFMAVFFPVGRVPGHHPDHHRRRAHRSRPRAGCWSAPAGWPSTAARAVAEGSSPNLPPVEPDERVAARKSPPSPCRPARPRAITEATLLSAMEGAGKTIDDDELREAMAGKGLGTPATRAAIIEGLIAERYLVREGRELIPTAKAFQLVTLLRGLGVAELTHAGTHRRVGIQAHPAGARPDSIATRS